MVETRTLNFGQRNHLLHAGGQGAKNFWGIALASPFDSSNRAADGFDVDAAFLKETIDARIRHLDERTQQVLGADVIVAKVAGFEVRETKDLIKHHRRLLRCVKGPHGVFLPNDFYIAVDDIGIGLRFEGADF